MTDALIAALNFLVLLLAAVGMLCFGRFLVRRRRWRRARRRLSHDRRPYVVEEDGEL